MKILLFSALLSMSVPAFAGRADVCSMNGMQATSVCGGASSFDLAALARRPSATDCYLECKPMSGGGNGNSYTKCFNACMRRR